MIAGIARLAVDTHRELPEPCEVKKLGRTVGLFAGLLLLAASTAYADIPLMINHQGLVKVGGLPFSGNGLFKFGFVDASGNWLWTNDGTHVGEIAGVAPEAGITLPVVNGIYNVRLGDTAFGNMVAIPSSVFDDDTVKLRVMFNDGTTGWQTLSPDQPVTATAYAYHAATADDATTLTGKTAVDMEVPSGYGIAGPTASAPPGYTYSGVILDSGWSPRAPMPTGRRHHVAAASGGLLYVFGGEDGGYLAENEAFDPATDSWTSKAPMPTARFACGAAEADGVVYVLGGYVVGGAISDLNEAYDTVTNTWSTKAPVPTGRESLCAVAVNGTIFAIGGRSNTTAYEDTVEAYNPATNTWTTKASMPTGRNALAAAAVGDTVYVVGGSISSDSFSNVNEAYDTVGNTWSAKASTPTRTRYAGVVGTGGKVFVIGGDNSDSPTATNEIYDPASDSWSYGTQLPTRRRQHTTTVMNGVIYAVGGNTGATTHDTVMEAMALLYLHWKD